MEKIDAVDMARARAYEAELMSMEANAAAKVAEFQKFVDELFAKHSLTKGLDRLDPDGTIVRAQKDSE